MSSAHQKTKHLCWCAKLFDCTYSNNSMLSISYVLTLLAWGSFRHFQGLTLWHNEIIYRFHNWGPWNQTGGGGGLQNTISSIWGEFMPPVGHTQQMALPALLGKNPTSGRTGNSMIISLWNFEAEEWLWPGARHEGGNLRHGQTPCWDRWFERRPA